MTKDKRNLLLSDSHEQIYVKRSFSTDDLEARGTLGNSTDKHY